MTTNYTKLFIKSLFAVAISAAVGLILLLLVFLIPTSNIEANVAASAPTIVEEGGYPGSSTFGSKNILDNYTDSIILLSASYTANESLMDRAMHIYTPAIGDNHPVNTLSAYYLEHITPLRHK